MYLKCYNQSFSDNDKLGQDSETITLQFILLLLLTRRE